MPRPKHEFGQARLLKAASIGQPGQRTFSVRVEAEGGRALARLGKQELLQLALSMQELLATHEARKDALPSELLPERLDLPDMEFQVGRLVIGYDRRHDRFVLEISDQESAGEDRTTLRVSAGRELISEFTEEALAVCAAGRPLCPLCQAAMGPGKHICPKTNGHIVL